MTSAGRLAIAALAGVAAAALAILPALAQQPPASSAGYDLTGEWAPRFHEDQPERIPGPEIGDYLGLPINAAARLHADSWDASILTLPEHQCKPHPSDYSPRGPANLRIWKEIDTPTQQLIAYHTHISWQAPERTIWMDGRPHPPAYAAHTWQGFSTGVWDGDMLTITTTHLKMGWIRRNGVPRSDEAVVTEHLVRHDNYLTWIVVIDDPVYLTEPFIRTTNFVWDPHQQIAPYPCQIVEEIDRPQGAVPHHLPGQNPFLTEFPAKFGVSPEAARGGAETTYPEYQWQAKTSPSSAARAPEPAQEREAFRRAAEPFRRAEPPSTRADDGEVHVLPVQGNVYMLVGAGGANITMQAGDEGVLLVDASAAALSDRVLKAIRSVSTRPIRYIINTHADADHVGGNAEIAKQGATISGGNMGQPYSGAAIIAHENVLTRMSAPTGEPSPFPQAAWPTDSYFTRKKELFFNGEAIEIRHQPSAHTDGDSIVFFRRSDVVSAGDLFVTTTYPVIDLERGGNMQGILAGLNTLLDITIPKEKQEGGTYVIPGHGRLCDEADVLEYRDMLTIVRDRIQDLVKKGSTLDQVKAARPTLDYDRRYGASSGPWTTDRFVEAVYRNLTAKQSKSP
jgi:glyoxylase-like metal-dependent hydrolase (beta-lactamase superfamily II)